MKYNKPKTESHIVSQTYPSCLVDLDELIFKEDDSLIEVGSEFDNSTVIDLDGVEILRAQAERRNQKSTMDCTFAISDNSKTEMLLVEFRFNYINLQNLNRNKLIDKVAGSQEILGDSTPINDNNIFIFQKDLKAQAQSRLYRMYPRVPNNYVVMDLDDLKSFF
ncbi:hypothetical protein [Flavobacterium sp. H122]|uniref:hypothetical protein n=1 Tax=Flavobacterium sp. H122 TaxID=2529860 RepID=UPI0010AAF8D1|nr:hypothetical protein [Flavobacterium sp. H122]